MILHGIFLYKYIGQFEGLLTLKTPVTNIHLADIQVER
jgi:hypothetical protein